MLNIYNKLHAERQKFPSQKIHLFVLQDFLQNLLFPSPQVLD